VEQVVSQVAGVARVSEKEDGKLEFETIPGSDPRPAVARAVVNAGYDLLEMRLVGMSLEEIFLQLTRDEPSPPESSQSVIEEDEIDLEEIPDQESDD
jgi:ABC-2 type transport system ATP-binding protein